MTNSVEVVRPTLPIMFDVPRNAFLRVRCESSVTRAPLNILQREVGLKASKSLMMEARFVGTTAGQWRLVTVADRMARCIGSLRSKVNRSERMLPGNRGPLKKLRGGFLARAHDGMSSLAGRSISLLVDSLGRTATLKLGYPQRVFRKYARLWATTTLTSSIQVDGGHLEAMPLGPLFKPGSETPRLACITSTSSVIRTTVRSGYVAVTREFDCRTRD